MAMKTVVALPGEGIGVEVVDATCELMTAAGMPREDPDAAPGRARRRRARAPARGDAAACREADGVLFGAAGPSTSAVVGWLRWEMERGAACGPRSSTRACARRWPIPRASTSSSSARTPRACIPGARAISPISSARCRTCATASAAASTATARAASRSRWSRAPAPSASPASPASWPASARRGASPGKVTCVTKSNVLPPDRRALPARPSRRSWREYRDLTFEHFHVDDAARRLVRFPKSMDVVLVHEPVRRHPLRHRAARSPAASASRPRATSATTAGPTSSRSTARRPTSRAGASPTRRRRSSPPR